MPIKIDKNKPMPQGGRNTEVSHTVQKMNVGDSVYVTTQREVSCFRSSITVHGFRAISRREGEGWRIWKGERTHTTV